MQLPLVSGFQFLDWNRTDENCLNRLSSPVSLSLFGLVSFLVKQIDKVGDPYGGTGVSVCLEKLSAIFKG